MQVLELTKRLWKTAAIYLDDDAGASEIVRSFLVNIFVVVVQLINVYGSAGCIYWTTESVEDVFYAFIQGGVNFGLGVNYVVYCVRKKDLAKLAIRSEEIVRNRYNASTAAFYDAAERKTHSVTKWPYLLYMGFYIVGLIFFTTISFVQDAMRGEYNVLKWHNIEHLRFSNHSYGPQDVKIHLVYVLVQLVHGSVHFVLVIMNMSTFIGFNYYTTAFCKNFQYIFDQMDEKLNCSCSPSSSLGRRIEIKKLLLDAVKFKRTLIQ